MTAKCAFSARKSVGGRNTVVSAGICAGLLDLEVRWISQTLNQGSSLVGRPLIATNFAIKMQDQLAPMRPSAVLYDVESLPGSKHHPVTLDWNRERGFG